MVERPGAFFLCLVLLLNLCSCALGNQGTAVKTHPKYDDFRDIPGITQEGIQQIEALQSSDMSFGYGMCPSIEAFYDEQGNIGGYTALFCAWLSDLFGIEFTPVTVEWSDLHDQMGAGTIDFTGEMTANKGFVLQSSLHGDNSHQPRMENASRRFGKSKCFDLGNGSGGHFCHLFNTRMPSLRYHGVF